MIKRRQSGRSDGAPRRGGDSPPARTAHSGGDRRKLVEQVGRRIRSLRVDRRGQRLTQGDIARKAHVSVSFLSMIERGERSPSIETLGDLADALGVSLCAFFDDGTPPAELNPTLRRLGDFMREHRLARADIDRLVAVAEAMFGR